MLFSRVLAVAALSLPLALAACGNDNDAPEPEAALQTSDADSGEAKSVPAPAGSLAGQDMTLGEDSAPVTMIEYASLTCPACANFHENVFPTLKEEYIDTGKARFVFREFPTSPAALSYAGSYLARCAATERGSPAYFAVIDSLFDRQREWAQGEEPGKVLEDVAMQAGLDRQELEDCFYREDVKQAVADNVTSAVDRYEVNSTPTIIVNEEKVQWGGDIDRLRRALDEAIANANG